MGTKHTLSKIGAPSVQHCMFYLYKGQSLVRTVVTVVPLLFCFIQTFESTSSFLHFLYFDSLHNPMDFLPRSSTKTAVSAVFTHHCQWQIQWPFLCPYNLASDLFSCPIAPFSNTSPVCHILAKFFFLSFRGSSLLFQLALTLP